MYPPPPGLWATIKGGQDDASTGFLPAPEPAEPVPDLRTARSERRRAFELHARREGGAGVDRLARESARDGGSEGADRVRRAAGGVRHPGVGAQDQLAEEPRQLRLQGPRRQPRL